MAERRMFSQTIIDSDDFLDMPTSTQALYFHLGMRADDEGFVNNPKKICRMIGSSQDELKLLVAKRFLLQFESGVVLIKHWLIHNMIRKDRMKETVYYSEKSLITIKENRSYTEIGETLAIPLVAECQPSDNQMSAQVRLGKVRLEEVSIDKYIMVADYYKYICNQYSQPRKMTDKRKGHIEARIEEYGINEVLTVLETINESKFLNDSIGTSWLNYDWFWNVNNFIKIIEGNYNKKVEVNNGQYKQDNKKGESGLGKYEGLEIDLSNM